MEINTQAGESAVKMVAIVRDKDGNPKFDDPHNVQPEVLKALTPKDLEYLEKLRNQ